MKKSKNKGNEKENIYINPSLVLQIEIANITEKLNEEIYALEIATKDAPAETTTRSTSFVTISESLKSYYGYTGTSYNLAVNKPKVPGKPYIYHITITKRTVIITELSPNCYKRVETHSNKLIICYDASETSLKLSTVIFDLMELLKQKSASLSALGDTI